MSTTKTFLAPQTRASMMIYRVVRSLVCWFTQAFTRIGNRFQLAEHGFLFHRFPVLERGGEQGRGSFGSV